MEFHNTDISNGKDGEKSYSTRRLLFVKNKRKRMFEKIDFRGKEQITGLNP
jgi:hypothetical protein